MTVYLVLDVLAVLSWCYCADGTARILSGYQSPFSSSALVKGFLLYQSLFPPGEMVAASKNGDREVWFENCSCWEGKMENILY